MIVERADRFLHVDLQERGDREKPRQDISHLARNFLFEFFAGIVEAVGQMQEQADFGHLLKESVKRP